MMPTIMPGQTVLISTNISDIRVGDIVIYDNPDNNSTVIHRVIQINETHFTPKGDNKEYDDGVYPIEAIRSVVYAVLY